MIYKYNLWDFIHEKYLQLIAIDEDQAISMFIDNVGTIPVEDVVKRLKKESKILHQYLHRLDIVKTLRQNFILDLDELQKY